jgi:uncharacterized protein (TIGR02300 family)
MLLTVGFDQTMGTRSKRQKRPFEVAKLELGTKRICPNCGAKYYDLDRNPIVCPRCGTHFEVAATPSRVRAQPAPEPEEEEEEVVAEPADAEFVTLEEADEETADAGAVAAEGVEDEEEVETTEEDTFLEEDDEQGDDVTDIIGGVEDEEP